MNKTNWREKPSVSRVATIVNKLFLDSDYRGKDWEAVRKQLIQDFSQELTSLAKSMLIELNMSDVESFGYHYWDGDYVPSPSEIEKLGGLMNEKIKQKQLAILKERGIDH